jgi:hypothetical protein
VKFIQIILEIIGWIQIALVTTILSGLIALPIYIKWSTDTGKLIAIAIIGIGFIAGSIWATIIWKKHGTVAWLSRIRHIS